MQIFVCKQVLLLLPKSNEAAKPKPGLIVAPGDKKWLQKAVRIMKIAAILLLATCLQVTAAGHAQKISLSEKDAPIEKIFKKIERMTDYKFLYMSELLDKANKVTISVKDASVEQVLDLCLKEQILEYEINERTIIIRPRTDLKSVATFNSPAFRPIEVRGVITDENGAPAQGVNVVVKGTSKGTTTNLKGEFMLSDVDENAVLLISSVGYNRQEISVKSKTFINAQLKVAVGNLDELQVIAYGTTSKRLQTGSVSTVKSITIEKQPVQNPLLALQGRVPGMEIIQGSGMPGSGIKVRIRGQNSINQGNDPLYVIDGVPYLSQNPSNLGNVWGGSGSSIANLNGNPLNYINPSDIEAIDILKDADATAIYGSRGANGVVLITTKNGKAGKMKFNANVQTGGSKVTRKIKLLNTRQYLDMRYEALKNNNIPVGNGSGGDVDLKVWDTTRYTDWQKELIGGTAKYNDFQTSISGGSSNIQYLVGAGYYKTTTVFPGDMSDQKASLHFNIKHTSTDQKFQFSLTGNYLDNKSDLIASDLTQRAFTLAPNAPPLYDASNSLNWAPNATGAPTWTNPLSYLTLKFNNRVNNIVSSAVISYRALPGLEIKSSFGYTFMQMDQSKLTPRSFNPPYYWAFTTRSSEFSDNTNRSWIIEPQITYNISIGNLGKISALIGSTFQDNSLKGRGVSASGFNSDLVLENISAATNVYGFSTLSQYRYNALFGRLSYNYENKYLINLTGRRDGTSRFAPEKRFHNFGAAGIAWIFTNERFIKNKIGCLSFGKLRGSFGTTGNDQVGDYSYLDLYSPVYVDVAYQDASGLRPSQLFTPDLAWEETKKLEAAITLGFFKDRILISTNYYRNRSSNQLVSYILPNVTGFNNIIKNLPALVENSGWEVEFNSINFDNKVIRWTTGVNISFNKNKLVRADPGMSASLQKIVGMPLGTFFVYHFMGVNPSTGIYQFLDNQGNPTSTPNFSRDANVAINLSPKFYGGFHNNISYRSLELDFLFQFVKQRGTNIYFVGNYPGAFSSGNQPVWVMDRWQKPGDNKSIQRFEQNFSAFNAYNNVRSSDFYYSTDASFIRLKNVSFSWTLPKVIANKLHIQNCKLTAHGQNLWTITNYKGLDPENQSGTSLPPLRIVTLGINVTF